MLTKRILTLLLTLIVILFFHGLDSSAQPRSKPEGKPVVKLGNITFQIREIESTPSKIRVLELQIEAINQSRVAGVPANTLKVLTTPKEVRFAENRPAGDFSLSPAEVVLTHALPPGIGRVVVVGFPLPKEKLERITFEIQINPPDGESKTVTWTGE